VGRHIRDNRALPAPCSCPPCDATYELESAEMVEQKPSKSSHKTSVEAETGSAETKGARIPRPTLSSRHYQR